jgi:dipeptidyl aminopeptidase/acylaminoacyl peptidase
VWVESGRQPAQLYHLDVAARQASLIDESKPWLDVAKLAPTHRLEAKASDGMRIEAFLTLPDVPGDRPLVLLPHGGPIGVADRLHFDPQVQFLASLGYAVLRVNFRGSAGYGRAFREAGMGQYGTGIEDDIDSALEHALANHPLDASRVCAVGSSYGGYSSLMAAVRRPERFRCVVSIAGVSDRILFFTASDSARNHAARPLMVQAMGDPHRDLEAMKRVSPLFQYASLDTPVMIVHGRDDLRVDYEHARRLARMLSLGGKPPTGLVFDKEGHGFTDIGNIEAAWEGVAGFLRRHLGGGGAGTPATAH